MNIILGASGRVGFSVVKELIKDNAPVRAVVRNTKATFDQRVEVKFADFHDSDQLNKALEGGTTVFLLTPENPFSNDIISETKQIIANYQEAIKSNGIKRIVGLSSIGAHLEGNTGNLLMSKMLEQAFDQIDVQKIFIRPAYYFSNWLGFKEPMEQYGVLPSFFPEDFKIHMISPMEVAEFIAQQITRDQIEAEEIHELVGPEKYSALDVAEIFSKVLNKDITVQTIPKEQWEETLTSAGFTDNTALNLIKMTQTVVDGRAVPQSLKKAHILKATLDKYLKLIHF